MPIRAFEFKLGDLSEKGQFAGVASTYGNVDLGGDVIEYGAFSKTLSESKSRPLLWMHTSPIGLVTLKDTASGLEAAGQLSLGIQLAKDTLTLMRDGVVKGLSIGFQSVQDEIRNGVRRLKEIKLWEVSIVTFPMNEQATVTSVKSIEFQRDEIAKATRDLHNFYVTLRNKNS